MKKLIIILLALMPIFATAQSTYDHQGKIRMRYNNGGSPDTLLIQFSGDSVLYDANNPFHKFAGGVIMDSIKLNGAWETSFIGSQWTTSGSDIYYNSGNVGINNASPVYKLDVNGLIGGSNIETNTTSLSTKVGYEAGLNENETGERSNSIFGYQAGYLTTTGSINVMIGSYAGQTNLTGSYNTMLGTKSGFKNTVGTHNLFLGYSAGGNNISGNYNVIIGNESRILGNSSYELVIDNKARGSSASDSLLYRSNSLIYGKFDADTMNQFVDVNGRLRYTGTFAEIYRSNDSTAYTQSIPTGTTPTKILAFSDNKYSINCTSDAENDNITITKQGYYKIDLFLSYQIGTSGVTFKAYIFQNGTAVDNIGSIGKPVNANDPRSTALGGLIHVTSVPCDIDYRVVHDNGGSINLTFQHLNMVATYIGE